MRVWIGTSGFQYPEWKGSFYPEDMQEMLPFYAERFNATEINYSFRHIPSAKTIGDWFKATPRMFRFSFKAPQKITHISRLRGGTETLEFFNAAIAKMKEKQGVVLFQLPPNFKKDVERLKAFVKVLPNKPRAAFEFRHDSWFDEEIFQTLRDHGVALCIAENEKLATPARATTNFGYLRLRREDYVARDFSRWAKFIRAQEQQWRDVFIYFKHEERSVGPKFAQQMMKRLIKAS